MVFSSFPVYLDHPNLHHQFQQQQEHHHHHQQQGSTTGVENNHLPPPPLPPVGGSGSSIRPGSMVDRARLAKLPLPEAGLKCPRCDSTNTKFCYFNNYSLTQPRHFCKTCRRYWTRGGALRSVPVGGGCRRNKKSKSSSSKSNSITTDQRQNNIATSAPISPSSCSADIAVGQFPQQANHQLPLMAALTNFNHYGFQAQMMNPAGNNGIPNMGFNLGAGNGNDLSGGAHDQWRLPSMGGFDQGTTTLFPFQTDQGVVEADQQQIGNSLGNGGSSGPVGSDQMASSVKSEENPAGILNLTKQFLVNSHDQNNQFSWGGSSSWTGFSGLNSSSTSHLL